MLYWITIGIAALLLLLLVWELFTERNWKKQLSIAMVIIPLLLRVFQMK